MAIIIKTDNPAGLLQAIYKAIDDKKVVTWEYDSDKDFTHTTSSDQWLGSGWLRPIIPANVKGELHFGLQTLTDEYTKSSYTYAVYHGRFIQMLLAHFDTLFTLASATALYTSEDSIGLPSA